VGADRELVDAMSEVSDTTADRTPPRLPNGRADSPPSAEGRTSPHASIDAQSAAEGERFAAVERLQILGTPREQSFDDIVRLAALILRTPIAAIGFFTPDHEFVKSEIGLGVSTIARANSICDAVAVEGRGLFIPDAHADERYAGAGAVVGPPFVRAYLGVPLRDPAGVVVGVLFAADTVPRSFGPDQIATLEILGRQVEQLFVLRASLLQLTDAQTTVRLRETRFRSVIQSLGLGLVVHRPDGAVEELNAMAESIIGVPRDVIKQEGPHSERWQPVHEDGTVFAPEDRPVAIALRYGIEVRDVIMGFRRPDGARRWLLVSVSPLWDHDGRGSGAVSTFTDVTDLLSLNAQLQESLGELARAAQERAALLSSVSHDIRAPLAAIRMMTEILDDRADAITDDQRVELVRRIRAEARRTEGALADLVSANRVGTGLDAPRRKRVDLEQLMFARAREFDGGTHTIRVGSLSGDLTLWADAAQVERMLDNLISNALTHTPAGTRVLIDAQELDGRIEFAVDDDGDGVAPELRERIFSAYFRGDRAHDRPGSGLGLFLVQQFAQFHGGTARCEPSARGGARFVVTLPRRPGHEARPTSRD
jgi:PAS domain S-box-containing protein